MSKSNSLGPGIYIRLSPSQIRLVKSGLNWIANNYQVRLEGGVSAGRSFGQVWKRNFDPGVYNHQFMDDLLAVRAKANSLSSSYSRLRFSSSFQVAACALAVRVAFKRHRHGHDQMDIPRIESVAKGALSRLEAVRKRAKRAEVRREGVDPYRKKSQDWRRFLVWLRVHVASCGCIPRQKRAGRSPRRALVDQFVNWTREELENRGEPIPDQDELRHSVRLDLAYVRRGRKGYDIRHLNKDKVFTSSQFATRFSMRMEKPSSRTKSQSGNQNKNTVRAQCKNQPKTAEWLKNVYRGLEELGYEDGNTPPEIATFSSPADSLAATERCDTAENLRGARLEKTSKAENPLPEGDTRLTENEKDLQSDALAGIILEWLTAKSLTSAEELVVLERAKQRNERLADGQSAPSRDPASKFVLGETGRPLKDKLERINFYEDFLVGAIQRVEPQQAIRDSALEKALRMVRSLEPHPPTPLRWERERNTIKHRRGKAAYIIEP